VVVRIPSHFVKQIVFYSIQYRGRRTNLMDNRPTNQFVAQSTEQPRKNARTFCFDVSSSDDLRDNCPSSLHRILVYCPVKVG
jgi:hypothetical protein